VFVRRIDVVKKVVALELEVDARPVTQKRWLVRRAGIGRDVTTTTEAWAR
jgi:hypothetical protein